MTEQENAVLDKIRAEIEAKPFDWNDNLSKEAIEDFEGIRKDLTYCTCQSIGMALAKLELLEKQGCKVIDPSGSSSEKPNKWIPVSERLPDKYTYTLWCASSGYVRSDYFNGEFWEDAKKYCYEVVAWMPLPEPYKAEGSDKE